MERLDGEGARHDIYLLVIPRWTMSAIGTGRLFNHGRSQAVRLPKEFRLSGDRVSIRRFGRGVLIEPIDPDPEAWFAALDAFAEVPFMEEGREQPPMPGERDSFEE